MTIFNMANARRWMLDNANFYRDSAGLIDSTGLAEGYAQECDSEGWLDDEVHPVWDVAAEVGIAIEKREGRG